MRLLALDFDGVISDSAPEAFVVSARTYLALRPDSALTDALRALTGAGAPALAAITGASPYAAWLRDMPLGNRAEDYGVLLRAREEGIALPDQSAYDAYRDSLDPAWLEAYHRRFYAERVALSSSDPAGWRGLMAPYEPMLEILRRHAAEVLLAIATSKDRSSVRALLDLYGVGALFPEERVLDKEAGASKTAHLEHLHASCRVAFPDITFVDDKANHLDAVSHLGVRCALATWGYNGPREEAVARAHGHLVCSLADVEAKLF